MNSNIFVIVNWLCPNLSSDLYLAGEDLRGPPQRISPYAMRMEQYASVLMNVAKGSNNLTPKSLII